MPSYINSEQIFPKRLGIMNGNTLVLEYYNLAKDKFKKHLMPFETQIQAKTIVEQIFKNPKHIPFLKKVNPKHITAVLQGQKIGFKAPAPQDNYQQFYQPKPAQRVIEQRNYQKENQNLNQQQFKHQEIVHQEINKQVQKPSFQIESIPAKVHEPQEYYNQQFQEFQISISMEKGSNLTSNFSKIQSSNPDKSSVSSISKNEPSKIEPVKQVKKQKKEKEVVQEIVQQYEDDFQFLDEEAQAKKDKKQKKQKKEKSKGKNKSKDKKQKKESKKQPKEEGGKNKVQDKQVEQEFQFL